MRGRPDPGGVAHRLLHGGQQSADSDQDDGVPDEGGGDQGHGEPAEHAEDHPGEHLGAGGVRAVVRVQGAQRPRHRVRGEIEPAERHQEKAGRGDGGDHAEGGLEPDVGGSPEARRADDGEAPDARGGGGGTAHEEQD